LQEANIRWFIIDTHGNSCTAAEAALRGVFAPVFTPELHCGRSGGTWISARQVWSKHEGLSPAT